MTWPEWIASHANRFAWRGEDDLRTLADWADLLESAGYTPALMERASRRLALGDVPRFKGDHLVALRRAANAIRDAEAGRGPPRAPKPSCGLCGGEGAALMPAPSGPDSRQRWCMVQCRCSPRGTHDPAPWGDYALRVPDWRLRVERWREERSRGFPAAAATWARLAAGMVKFGEGQA